MDKASASVLDVAGSKRKRQDTIDAPTAKKTKAEEPAQAAARAAADSVWVEVENNCRVAKSSKQWVSILDLARLLWC